MPIERWIGGNGQGLTWGNAFSTATLNSIASGNGILSDISITNGTALDIFADVSINLGSAAFVAPNYIGVYLYPTNDVGTYGDGQFASSAAGTPGAQYAVGNIVLVAATQAQTGTLTRIVLVPGTFKFVLWNQSGIALAASGNTCLYRTYNRSVT